MARTKRYADLGRATRQPWTQKSLICMLRVSGSSKLPKSAHKPILNNPFFSHQISTTRAQLLDSSLYIFQNTPIRPSSRRPGIRKAKYAINPSMCKATRPEPKPLPAQYILSPIAPHPVKITCRVLVTINSMRQILARWGYDPGLLRSMTL